MPWQTPTAPTSVESHPNVEERDVRMGHPAFYLSDKGPTRPSTKVVYASLVETDR
jgi:hypothetical protein